MKKLFYIAVLFSIMMHSQTYTGGINTATGFHISDPQPGDDRTVSDDSTGLLNIHDKFEGLPSYSKGDNRPFWYNGTTWDKGALMIDVTNNLNLATLQRVLDNSPTADIGSNNIGITSNNVNISATTPGQLNVSASDCGFGNDYGSFQVSAAGLVYAGIVGSLAYGTGGFDISNAFGNLNMSSSGISIYDGSRYIELNSTYGYRVIGSGYELRVNSSGIGVGNGGAIKYTLPLVDGTSNQILVSNGSGSVTWRTRSIADLTYSNGASGLSATNGQSAIDELNTNSILTKTLTRKLINSTTTTGTYNLDYNNFAVQRLNLTGNVTLTESNLPTTDTEVRVVSLLVIPNGYTLTPPASWSGKMYGTPSTTDRYMIVITVYGNVDYWITFNPAI